VGVTEGGSMEGITLELYYDSTVEPFAEPEFNMEKIQQLLKTLIEKKKVRVKIVDTAGWSREMLYEVFKKACRKDKSLGDIFSSKQRRGWFFGREVPALLIIRGKKIVDVYPQRRDNNVETIASYLQALLMELGEEK